MLQNLYPQVKGLKPSKCSRMGVEITAEEMPVQLSSAGNEIRNFEFDFVYTDNKVSDI